MRRGDHAEMRRGDHGESTRAEAGEGGRRRQAVAEAKLTRIEIESKLKAVEYATAAVAISA